MLSAIYGFGALILVAAVVVAWIGTRRILLSPYPGTPFEANFEGWQGLAGLIRAWPAFALIAVAVKLTQVLSSSLRTLTLTHLPIPWLAAGILIDLGFALAWAFVALRIDLAILAPDASKKDANRRVRRALIYALGFYGVNVVINIVAFLLAIGLHPMAQRILVTVLFYVPYFLIVLSALTRPAIAIGLPRPFRECLRMLRENWFGIAVTLGIGALPLGAIFLGAFVIRVTAHLSITKAVLFEIPLAMLAAACYAGFESVIAAMYRRIM